MRRERQHVKRRWSFVGSVKAIVNKVKPSTGDRHNGNFKGITLTTGTHIDLTNNTKRSQSLYRRSSNENQNSSSHNAVSVSKSVPHTSHSFNHLLSSKQHGQRHGLTREELDEDVRRIVTHSDQKATALKVLKSRLLGDSGHSTGSGAEQTDSDVYLSDDPRNNQPRTLSQQNKPANSKIATSLRRAATSSRDYVKNDKNKKKQMLKSELFDQADGKKRFMLAATDNSGSILDKYIANARESAWVMGKKSAQQAKYEQEVKESETEESYTASDWSEDTSSCTDESADYSTSGWSSNNSESEEVTASSSESSGDDIISSDDQELTPLQSHKNNLKSSISTDSKLDRKAQQSREKVELERIPSKPSEIKKQNKLPSKEQTLSSNNMQPTVSSSSTSNRLRPKTPPRRRAPSSHQQKKCSIDEDLDEDDTNKVLALGDLIVQKAVEMNIEIEIEEEKDMEETIHETEELVTEYEEEIVEELVTASEEEEEEDEEVVTQDENEMNLKLGDAISSHHSSCSHETSDDEVMEEQTLDTGSGISHEEYREDLMIRPELETIIEEEEENNNSPHPRKNRNRKDRKSSYEGAITLTGNGQNFCSPRFQSRTACFANLSPKSASALVGANGSSFVGIPQDVKVNQARERLHMQLGGCAKPCIKLPTADDVVTKPQDQDLKVAKPRPLTPPDLAKLHPSPTLDRVNSYQQAAAGISKPIVIPENLSGKTQALPKATKALLNDTKTVVQVIEVEETTITRRKKKKDMTDKKAGKVKKGKKEKVHEDVLPEKEFQSDRIGAQVEMYEEKIELTTQEESHVSPKKEKKRIEREQKKRKKLMELIGEEAAKKVLSEDAEVIVVDKLGRRECIQAIKENPIAKVQSNKKPSKSSSKPLKGSKTSSSSSTSSSSRFIPTAGGEMLTTKSSSANSSSANTDRSSPSSYAPSTSSPEHDDDGWRRESHESSSGVSTMNSDQALTPERNNSLDEHNDSGLHSTPSKSDRSKKPRDRTSDNNNVRAATTTIQAAAQLSALDSVNAILNAKKKDKKSKKSNKSSSSSGKQIPMRV